MTAHVPFERSLSDANVVAIDDVNRWRGHCVESYARVECEVTETLCAMAAIPASKVTVPHSFGEKIKKLREIVAAEGPFPRAKLAEALLGFASQIDRRNLLVHASGKVWIDAKGGWLWRYCFRPAGKGKAPVEGSFEQDEALEIEKTLARDSQSLGGQLRALRQKLEAATK